MIKAIIFDYGGVVTNETDPQVYRAIARACRVSHAAAKKLIPVLSDPLVAGTISEETFWQRFRKKTGAVLPKNYRSLWVVHYKRFKRKRKTVLALVKRLKKKGYLVPLLSNTIAAHARHNRAHNNFRHFHPVFLSCELGTYKPKPAIYHTVLKKLRLRPGEAVFIDDRRVNVAAARKLGIHAIEYTNLRDVKGKLRLVGVLL